jgi:hypothetical protein
LEVKMKGVSRFAGMLGVVAVMGGVGAAGAAADPGGSPNMNAKGHGECGPPGAFIKQLAKAPAGSVPDVIGAPPGSLVRMGCEFE